MVKDGWNIIHSIWSAVRKVNVFYKFSEKVVSTYIIGQPTSQKLDKSTEFTIVVGRYIQRPPPEGRSLNNIEKIINSVCSDPWWWRTCILISCFVIPLWSICIRLWRQDSIDSVHHSFPLGFVTLQPPKTISTGFISISNLSAVMNFICKQMYQWILIAMKTMGY